jgi:hypothetical protein
LIGAESGSLPGMLEGAPSIGIIRTGTKGLSQPGDLPSTPA